MEYKIEVDPDLNTVLTKNAAQRNMPVPALIAELLKRYVIDAHIMEQTDIRSRIEECADINLDWANL